MERTQEGTALILYSSSGEWDERPVSELEDTFLRDTARTLLGKDEEATEPFSLLTSDAYYYLLPASYPAPDNSRRLKQGVIAVAIDTSASTDMLHQHALHNFLILIALCLGIPILLAILIHSTVIHPIRHILEVIEDRISGNMHAYIEMQRRDELGRLAGALNTLFEKQKKAEKGIRYSSDLIQTVIDNVPGVVFWKDRKGKYLGCNQAFADIADNSNIDDIIGHTDDKLAWPPDIAELYTRHDKDVMQQNAPAIQEEFILLPDGPRWTEMHKIPLRDDRRRVIGILGLCFDITHRKHVEQEHEQWGTLNKLLFELATRVKRESGAGTSRDAALKRICKSVARELTCDRVSIWKFTDKQSSVTLHTVSGKAASDLTPGMGYPVADYSIYYAPILLGRSNVAHNTHSDALASVFLDSRLSKYDRHAMMEVPIIVAGSVWGTICLEHLSQHYSWNPQEEQFIRSLADVVALMIANEQHQVMTSEISEQKDFLELILEATRDGIWDWNVKSDTLVFSAQWKAMLGYSEEEVEDSYEAFESLLHPEDVEHTTEAVKSYLEHKEGIYEVAFRMRTKEGSYKWILSRGKSSFDHNGNALRFVGTHTDIDELKRAEEEVQRQKHVVDRIIENLPVGMFAKSVKDDFRYIIWNRQMEKIFDQPRTQMLGKNDFDHFDKKEAGYRRFTDQQLLESEVPVEIYEEIQSEWGRDVSVNIKKFAIMNTDNEPEMVIGIVDDITDLMDAQRELEEHRNHLESLVEAQTRDLIIAKEEAESANQAKSDFLANMSHELRTPMHAIISYSQLGEDKAGSIAKDKVIKYFHNIHTSGKRLLHLLNDLLDLSKMEAGHMEYHFSTQDMYKTLNTLKEEVNMLLDDKSLTLDIIKKTSDMSAWYDEGRMMQVLMNLLSNAIKFTPEGKTIQVELSEELLNGEYGAIPGLKIVVKDQGVGIPDDELKTIFDKFSQSTRTKTGAGGTGLGLAISREILMAHHGIIWAENNPKGGAKFILVIPRKNPTID